MKTNIATLFSLIALTTACGGDSKCEQVAEIAQQCFPIAQQQEKSEIAKQCEQAKAANKFWAKQSIECVEEFTGDCDAHELCIDPEKLETLRDQKDADKRVNRQKIMDKAKREKEEQANDTVYQHEKALQKEAGLVKQAELKEKRAAKKAAAEAAAESADE
jgi:hypothetical protein